MTDYLGVDMTIVRRFLAHRWVPTAATLTVISLTLAFVGESTQTAPALNLALGLIVVSAFFWGSAQREAQTSK